MKRTSRSLFLLFSNLEQKYVLHLVVDNFDVVAERFEGRNDHPVLKGLGDEDDVLAEHGLEGVVVQSKVLEGGQRRKVLQHRDHVLQARITRTNSDAS